MGVGRSQKENADYFPHDADASTDEKLIYLESKFGMNGYGFYFKMLEILTRSNGFKIEYNDIKKSVYVKRVGLSFREFDEILDECLRDEIKAFVIENGYLYSPGLIKRLTPLVEKRENMRIKYAEMKQKESESAISETENTNSESETTQSKEEKSKVKKSINIYSSKFESFWLSGMWNKQGKKDAKRIFNRDIKTEQDWQDILKARDNYATHLSLNKWKVPQNGKTWFNNWRDFVIWVESEASINDEEQVRFIDK